MKLLEQISSKSPLNSLKQKQKHQNLPLLQNHQPKQKSFTTSIKGIGLTTFLLLLASMSLLTNFLQQLGWAVSSLVVTDWEKWCLSIYSFKYNSITKDFVGPEAISLTEVCLYQNSQDFFVNFKRFLHSCITFQAWISSVYCTLFAIGVMFTTFSIGSA